MSITLDEQIAWQKWRLGNVRHKLSQPSEIANEEAILATLERIQKAEAGLPVEPANRIRVVNITENGNKTEIIEHVLVVDYDTIRDYAVQKEAENTALLQVLECAESEPYATPKLVNAIRTYHANTYAIDQARAK